MPPNRSRATRLAKHWIHTVFGPTLVSGGGALVLDMLSGWRTAFGTSSTGTMTVMRILGKLNVEIIANGSTGQLVWGFIVGSINAPPAARPNTSGVDDFTNWLGWGGWPVPLSASPAEDRLEPERFDLRAMRKFDPSRETIWLIIGESNGEANNAQIWGFIRLLCGE